MLELWCQEGCRVGGWYVEVFVSGAIVSGAVVLWLLCRGVRVGVDGVGAIVLWLLC